MMKDLIRTLLRLKADLFRQGPNVIHRIITGGVELLDVQRRILVKRHAAAAFVARLVISGPVLTVEDFGQRYGRWSSYQPRAARKKRKAWAK